MKWKKHGLIFSSDKNYPWMQTHATLPIAKILHDDVYRIFFSSRNNLNYSYTCYLDIDIKNPSNTLKLSESPVLSPGPLGSFDDCGAMATCIVENENKQYLYYIGWNQGKNIPYKNSIGLAIKEKNNSSFQKFSLGPILDRNKDDPYFLASCDVLIENGLWKMWYLSCLGWDQSHDVPNPHYTIKYAESSDGINWKRNNKICINFKNNDEWAISTPRIIKFKNTYFMWYSFRGKQTYRIGYAKSNDGINWKRFDECAGISVSDSGWDSKMIEYPFIFKHNDKTYMLYNGNDYGKTGFGYAILE